ncbi:hypothetical protein JCM3774_000306 [Rhodotorula dairenensis]
MKSILALTAAAALFGASSVSASAAVHGQGLHRRTAERIHRITKRAETAALLAVQNSTSTPAETHSTTAIWWAEDGWTGSCGVKIDNAANTVGLPLALYPDADAKSSLCGQTAYAVNTATGQSVSVVVVDGSDRSSYATFSKTAYLALGGDLDAGMLPITLTLSQAAAEAAVAEAAASAPGSASAAVAAASVTTEKATSAASTTSAVSSATSTVASTTKAATTSTPPTTAAPATTTTRDQAAIEAASSSKVWEQQQSLQLAAKAASSSEAAAAYAASQAAASQAAASQAAASEAAQAQAQASQAAASKAAQEAAAAAAASSSEAAAQAQASQAAAAAAAAAEAQKKPTGGNVYTGGYATYYTQNGVAGHCGSVNPDSAYIVALPSATYAGGSHCGQQVTITRTSTGKTIQATVADSCPTCVNNACLDLSVAAFTAIATEAEGMVDITWQFI